MLHVGLNVVIHGQSGVVNASEQICFGIMDMGSRVFQIAEHILDVMAVHPEKLLFHQSRRDYIVPEPKADPVGQQGVDNDPHDFVHFLLAVILGKRFITHFFLDNLP